MKFGWILGSFLLCAGGFVLSTLGIVIVQSDSLPVLLGLWAAGAFIAGFAAARASAGSTIIEPAVGVVLFVVAVVASFMATPVGDVFVAIAKTIPDARDEMLILLAEIGGAFLVGGVLGAWVGEKIQTRAGDIGPVLSSVLAFLMILGGFFWGVFLGTLTMIGGSTMDPAIIALIGIGVGSLIGGVASGRAGAGFIATFVGAMGTCMMLVMAAGAGGTDSQAFFGIVIISIGVVIVSAFGGVLGRIGAKPTRES